MSRIEVSRSVREIVIIIHPDAGLDGWAALLFMLLPFVAMIYGSWRVGVLLASGESTYASGPLMLIFVGFLIAISFLAATILAMLWKLYGREKVTIDAARLRVERALGAIRARRCFDLYEISNVRWRERRIAKKHGFYQQKIVSFEAAGKTFDLGTYLSLHEAVQLEREMISAIAAWRRPDDVTNKF